MAFIEPSQIADDVAVGDVHHREIVRDLIVIRIKERPLSDGDRTNPDFKRSLDFDKAAGTFGVDG